MHPMLTIRLDCKFLFSFGNLQLMSKRYDSKLVPPFDTGFEAIGVVKLVGPEVSTVKPGDAVAIACPFGCSG